MRSRDIWPEPERAVAAWDHVVDVAVVGLGAAGASAAIEASRRGAEVLVLERTTGGGGASALSGGEIYLGGELASRPPAALRIHPRPWLHIWPPRLARVVRRVV